MSSVLWLILLLSHYCHCLNLSYQVREENNPITYIGSIATNKQFLKSFSLEERKLITFNQLQQKESQLFNVTTAGKLYTLQTIDAESLCRYNKECFKIVKVAVHKEKTFVRILKVKIIIEDINDHQPEFPKKEITIHFGEGDREGMKKSIPNAIDKDVSFKNRLIQYKLKNSNQFFSLEIFKRADGVSYLEVVLEEKLDREIKDVYDIEVIAEDGGTPAKQTTLNVKIIVDDENDNRPVFSRRMYNLSLAKTHTRNKPIVVLSAQDSDSGNNGKVSYYFSAMTSEMDSKYFQLKSETGEIFIADPSSLQEKVTYELFIEARDGGAPPLSSIATVLVNVINQQNSPPNIDVNFISTHNHNTATILEDVNVGSFIAYVMVTDNDAGHNGEVKCHIKDDTFKLQSMGSKEYKIVLKKAVDRETQEHYHFTVSCEDKGLPALKTVKDLSIQVLDVNDVKPHFTKDTFKFLTYENDKANFPIGFINATDPDIGKGGELSYHLRSSKKQEYHLPFQIINSGFISTNQSLDREHRDFYEFEVFVKDNGTPSLNNTVNVEVEVLDRNDNAPYFTFPSVDPFTLDVHYHPQSKNDITVLKASDIDSHMNAFLRYEIMSGNERQLFKLDSFTGVLSYSHTVYQNDAGSYYLEFVVKDSGTPVLSARTSVSLTLTVSNKTSPMFTAVHLPSDNTIDATLLIIIVVAAVIVSIAIVVSITLCIMRCNNVRNSSAGRTEEKQAYQCHNEMRQLIYQGNNSVAVMSGNRGEISDRYSHSRSHCYPEDWKTATINRTLQKSTRQKYSQPIEVTSYGDNKPSSNYPSDTLTSRKSSGQCWSERSSRQYEEIPAMSGIYGGQPDTTVNIQQQQQHYQDRYVKPPERQLPSTPDVVTN
ncbi:protocadherin beta-15-like [Argonauta hians]